MFSIHVTVGFPSLLFLFNPFILWKVVDYILHLQSPFGMFFFCEKGTGQNRQGAGSMLPVCICIKKLIDSAGLLKCEPSGNRLFGKVDDGFQNLTTHSAQQVYCLQECGFKESNNVILLWKGSFVRTFITLPFSVNGSTFMKHCVALPALLLYFFTSFLSSYSLIIIIFVPDFEEVGVKI